jgi:hypothetical protein
MDDMIGLVLKCLKCKNNGIIFVSLNFLEIVRLFDPKYNEEIKTKKFKIQNQVKIKKIIFRDLSSFYKLLKENMLKIKIATITTSLKKDKTMTMMIKIMEMIIKNTTIIKMEMMTMTNITR